MHQCFPFKHFFYILILVLIRFFDLVKMPDGSLTAVKKKEILGFHHRKVIPTFFCNLNLFIKGKGRVLFSFKSAKNF